MNRARVEKHPILLAKTEEYNAAYEQQEMNQFNPLDPSFNFPQFARSNPLKTQTVLSVVNSADVLLKLRSLQDMLEKVIKSEYNINKLKFTVPFKDQNEESSDLAVELLDVISATGANISPELSQILTNAHMGCNIEMVGIIEEIFGIE